MDPLLIRWLYLIVQDHDGDLMNIEFPDGVDIEVQIDEELASVVDPISPQGGRLGSVPVSSPTVEITIRARAGIRHTGPLMTVRGRKSTSPGGSTGQ